MADITIPADLWARITEALGLPADAPPEVAAAALEDLVTTPPADPAAVAAAAGLATLKIAELDKLRTDAEEGREIAAAARKRKVTDLVAASIKRGAITVARRGHWITMIEADPSMADTLAKTPDEFAVPMTEIGHGIDNDLHMVEPSDWVR